MMSNLSSLFVLRVGLEPTRPCGQGILSPSCLPFHHQSDLFYLSGKRDSNSRPRPWQGRALPTELFPLYFSFQKRVQKYNLFSNYQNIFYFFFKFSSFHQKYSVVHHLHNHFNINLSNAPSHTHSPNTFFFHFPPHPSLLFCQFFPKISSNFQKSPSFLSCFLLDS